MRFVDLDGWAAVLSLQGVLVACMPAQSNRGLERELQAARAEAAVEQRRVYELEARLARLEYHAEQPPATPVANPAGGDPTVQRQLDALIALNQELLREVQANRERTALAAPAVAPPAPVPAVLTPPAAAQQSQTASTLGPECNTGLTTEQKILQLVLELKGNRSPWRVDGLTYEESQALRVLLRGERPLDHENPWQ